MSKVIDEFIADVKEQKMKQLLGIVMDKAYWESIIGKTDVDALRKELAAEKEKVVKSKQGTTLSDERDFTKINGLEQDINNIEKAEQEHARLVQMEKQIHHYLSFVTNPSKEIQKQMEEVTKIAK